MHATLQTIASRNQHVFSPVDYRFEWTDTWYTWDRDAAHKDAMKARNEAMKLAKAVGCRVKAFSIPGQILSRGGIGSGRPHIELGATCYGFNILSRPEGR